MLKPEARQLEKRSSSRNSMAHCQCQQCKLHHMTSPHRSR